MTIFFTHIYTIIIYIILEAIRENVIFLLIFIYIYIFTDIFTVIYIYSSYTLPMINMYKNYFLILIIFIYSNTFLHFLLDDVYFRNIYSSFMYIIFMCIICI